MQSGALIALNVAWAMSEARANGRHPAMLATTASRMLRRLVMDMFTLP